MTRAMRSSTGRWVSGDNFFDREAELRILESHVRDRNHVLLTGQRRMGKTSILRELGRRLEVDRWIFLFVDVEGATCAEDAIAYIARAVHPIRPISSRFASDMKRWVSENIDEISAFDFGVKIRAGLDAGSWRHHGETLIRVCAAQEQPVLLVIDELTDLPQTHFPQRRSFRAGRRIPELAARPSPSARGRRPVLVVSGSIGLEPLVRRFGIPDRINHLYPFRLGPWTREASIECFGRLAESHELRVEDGVAEAVYEALGIGIPHARSVLLRTPAGFHHDAGA